MATKKHASSTKVMALMTPDWLQDNINNTQKRQDAKDADNLKIYNSGCADWVANNILKREREGASFTPTAPPPLPTITTFFDGGGFMDERTVSNPNAKPPVLPPPVATNPDQPAFGGTGAGARDDLMFKMLNAILRDLAAVKAAVVN